MAHSISKVNLFSRYNLAVFMLFVLLTLLATGIAVYRYHTELSQQLDDDMVELAEQAEIINHSLAQSQQTLQGLKQFAQYYLAHPDDLYASSPLLKQEGDKFYLKSESRDELKDRKRLQANITGRGQIANFDANMWQELTMANALTPGFVTGSNTNPDATWFYYLSLNRFIAIYPWIGHRAWHYSDHMLNETFLWQIRQQNINGQSFVWSQPYQDAAGKGLKAAIGTGVFFEQTFKGALVIDLDLASLREKLPEITNENHGFVLVNNKGRVLVQRSQTSQLNAQDTWRDIVPDGLQTLTQANLMSFEESFIYRDWLLQKYHLPINGWSLIKYQPYHDFTATLKNRFIYFVAVFFIGLAAFLTLVYVMTRKTFIKPASEFISHIEHCAEGNPGKVKPTKEWLPWFRLVENIFGQNRSLLLQLKEQNAALDSRVAEKTQALIERSEQYHRAYVLLRSVIDGIPEFIIFYDNDNLLTGCNKSFERYIGDNESDLLGTEINTLLPPPIQQTLNEFANLPASETTVGYQSMVETSGDTYEIFCTHFYNEQGNSLGSIVILRDVSVQTAVQSALQSAKDQAEQANQAKSQFLANMSHEIRTPINAIQGMMALMAKTSLSAFQQQYLANAQSASAALLHLIDELLDLSKIEAGKLRLNLGSAKLDEVIDRVLQLNTLNAHKKGLQLNINIDADTPEVITIDEMRLTQVLTNLVNNAVKFTHHGSVSLTVTATGQDNHNALLKFVVTDTGIGIAHSKQSKLFDAFNQVDDSMTREYGGSGLGLSISQQIVELFGGEIKVNSTPNIGSEFSFVIPVRIDSQDAPQYCQNVTLVTIGEEFSESLQQAVKKYGWYYHNTMDLAEFTDLTLANDTVVLVSDNYLQANNKVDLKAIEQAQPSIVLLGICQPIMAAISEAVINQLPALKVPYLLFDIPLYRFTLSKINHHLLLAERATHVSDTPVLVEQASEKAVEPAPKAPLADSLAGISVLLVEDNLVNQMVAQELLFSMGAQVTIAENGAVAIDCLADNAIDVVLMDIQMPVMDGLSASRHIRAQKCYQNLPIIAMTAHARAEDKKASIDAGMNLHVAKPVSAEVLSTSIIKVMQLTELAD